MQNPEIGSESMVEPEEDIDLSKFEPSSFLEDQSRSNAAASGDVGVNLQCEAVLPSGQVAICVGCTTNCAQLRTDGYCYMVSNSTLNGNGDDSNSTETVDMGSKSWQNTPRDPTVSGAASIGAGVQQASGGNLAGNINDYASMSGYTPSKTFSSLADIRPPVSLLEAARSSSNAVRNAAQQPGIITRYPKNSVPLDVRGPQNKTNSMIQQQMNMVLTTSPYNTDKNNFCIINPHSDDISSCFPGDSLVESDRGPVALSSIQEGDLVLGASGFEPIVRWIHDSALRMDYLNLQVEDQSIRLSAQHMVFLADGRSKQARHVDIGDLLVTVKGPASVVKISYGTTQSFRAPLTRSGTVFVDGVLASNYATAAPGVSHSVAHFGFLPLRYLPVLSAEGTNLQQVIRISS